jgi:hypothetical protein
MRVIVYHNVAQDQAGRRLGFDGYQPGHPLAAVFTYDADLPGSDLDGLLRTAEAAFEAFNADPEMLADRQQELAIRYRGRVAYTVAPCGPDHRRGRRASGRPVSVSHVQGGRTDEGQDLAMAGAAARPA